ncbi:MAG: hypothetical protein IT479_07405 [Xanthomonadales bacterium]|nr:hypothetical protein [Xanthomonadales bacterium]MCC6593089.1 hypothetical protein [Xanthomonadales bacterium]MCE7932248.1 hypothetical protein [Xanthomonadales bacterium PRO6]
MNPTRLPSRWQSAALALKAVQVAFDVSESVLQAVRRAAFDANLSNSDQIRVVLGLPVIRQAKRPRLTVSLGPEDYQLLGKRYRLDPADHLAIKERVNAELIAFADERSSHSTARKSAKR